MAQQPAITATKVQATLQRTERLLAEVDLKQRIRRANVARMDAERKDQERTNYINFCLAMDI